PTFVPTSVPTLAPAPTLLPAPTSTQQVPARCTPTTATGPFNLRDLPGAKQKIIRAVKPGDAVFVFEWSLPIDEGNSPWFHVKSIDGTVLGWIASRTLVGNVFYYLDCQSFDPRVPPEQYPFPRKP